MNRTNDSLRIARNIREVRVANNLTQLEMAETLGYTERTIRRLETSGTDNISVINLITFKSVARYGYTAQDSSQGQTDDAYCSLYKTNLFGGQSQSSFGNGVYQKRDGHLSQLSFG